MARVVVAMSGGIDSLAAALLLLRDGYEVVGITMDTGCLASQVIADVKQQAAALGIQHHVLDLRAEFDQAVLAPFATAYAAGRTPNPCVVCNSRIKFGLLLAQGLARGGADRFATGHYVRLGTADDVGYPERLCLRRALDLSKDQSYALYALSQQQLRQVLFPLGGLRKSEVRQLVAQSGIRVPPAAESQDLCFAGLGGYREFVRARWPEGFQTGPVLDAAGRRIGTHSGIANYTVGQRRGLGISSDSPLYVLEIRPETQAVVVGPGDLAKRAGLVAQDCVWQAIPGLGDAERRAQVQIRYAARAVEARLRPDPGGEQATQVLFDRPQRAVTPGQATVFYDGDTVLGGGTIAREQPETGQRHEPSDCVHPGTEAGKSQADPTTARLGQTWPHCNF